jgi:hypothetical protein
MPSPVRRFLIAVLLGVSTLSVALIARSAQDSPELPAALAPFEHLIGAWKGQGIPTANRIRGWPERHVWAWAFEKGEPVGLTIELTGDKILASGRLVFDEKRKLYHLDGSDTEQKPVAFSGKIDDGQTVLTLERDAPLAGGVVQRLTFRLNPNKIRYTVWDDQQSPGSPQPKRVTEMQMGKEGESLGGEDAADKGPKCIVTGGAATMTVTANGKSFPICCTGCRDEVRENPEKYEKKLALRLAAGPTEAKVAGGNEASTVSPSEGSSRPKATGKAASRKQPPAEEDRSAKAVDKAADLLERAAALEKGGKKDAALVYYRMIVKDHPKSEQAKPARERINALAR